jgi:hypothetical protein
MSLEVTGKLIEKYDTQQVSDKFKKREFVLELEEVINGNIYTNFAKLQLVQNKCDILNPFNLGDKVKVSFNIKGNKWSRDNKVNYITNLDAWRIEAATGDAPSQGGGNQAPAYNNNNGGGNNYGNQQGGGNYGNNSGGNFNQSQGFNQSAEPVDDLPF